MCIYQACLSGVYITGYTSRGVYNRVYLSGVYNRVNLSGVYNGLTSRVCFLPVSLLGSVLSVAGFLPVSLLVDSSCSRYSRFTVGGSTLCAGFIPWFKPGSHPGLLFRFTVGEQLFSLFHLFLTLLTFRLKPRTRAVQG